MCEIAGAVGFAPKTQYPNFPKNQRKTMYDVIQDAVEMEKITKLADRIIELKSKPENELKPSERLELLYYNTLKSIAKLSQFDKVLY